MREYKWSNGATQDFAEWLIEDIAGLEMAREISREPTDEDTPVINLAAKLRGIITKNIPIRMDPEWLAEINWIEVAAYLVDNVDLDK